MNKLNIKPFLLILVALFMLVPESRAQKKGVSGYIMNMGGAYQWGPGRYGGIFQTNYNLSGSRTFPLFIGVDFGLTSVEYDNQFSQSQINSMAKADMRGNVLTNAYINSSTTEGFLWGFNMHQYIFTNSRNMPMIGLGLLYTQFPEEVFSITHRSEDQSYWYSGSTDAVVNEAEWKLGFQFSAHLGTSSYGAFYSIYPSDLGAIHMIGLQYVIADRAYYTK